MIYMFLEGTSVLRAVDDDEDCFGMQWEGVIYDGGVGTFLQP